VPKYYSRDDEALIRAATPDEVRAGRPAYEYYDRKADTWAPDNGIGLSVVTGDAVMISAADAEALRAKLRSRA